MDPVESALTHLRDRDHPVFSTHGPMAVEALEALGLPERAPAWALDYAKAQQLVAIPPSPGAPERGLELGDSARRASWVEHVEQAVEARGWQHGVRGWLPKLLPAASCEAAHGLIRTAHAVRSLARRASPARRHELAEAIGYWASSFETLPGAPGSGRRGLPSEALARVPVVPLDEQVFEGSIVDRLRALSSLPGFAEAVSALAPDEDLDAFANDLSRESARLYLANAPRARVIDFIHAVDGVYAVRELLPWLSPDAAREALFHGWQTVAALHASAGGGQVPDPLPEVDPSAMPDLVGRAVEIGGAHAIKFAQACVAEHENRPDPVYCAALEDAVVRMETLKDRLGMVI